MRVELACRASGPRAVAGGRDPAVGSGNVTTRDRLLKEKHSGFVMPEEEQPPEPRIYDARACGTNPQRPHTPTAWLTLSKVPNSRRAGDMSGTISARA